MSPLKVKLINIFALLLLFLLVVLAFSAVFNRGGCGGGGGQRPPGKQRTPLLPSPDRDQDQEPGPGPCLAGAVLVQEGGRLGNLLMEYGSAWAVARHCRLRPFAPTHLLATLDVIFESLSVPAVSEYLATDAQCRNVTEKDVLRSPVTTIRSLDGCAERLSALRKPIVLRHYIILTLAIAPLADQLRTEFRFRAPYRKHAAATLQAAAGRLLVSPQQEVVYVGIHVRRTDYQAYLKRKFRVQRFPDLQYFDRAVTWMLRTLGEGAPPGVVLVVISDDMNWCIRTLIPHLEKTHRSAENSDRFAVHPAGVGGSEDPAYDLATLAACNHSIITYGTFGVWSALMAGGYTVVFDIQTSPGNGNATGKNSAMSFAEFLPNWRSMY